MGVDGRGRGADGRGRGADGLRWIPADDADDGRPLARGRHGPVVFDIAEQRQRRRTSTVEGDGGSTAMARNIQSLERAAAMLRLLGGGERRLGLSDIASSLGL